MGWEDMLAGRRRGVKSFLVGGEEGRTRRRRRVIMGGFMGHRGVVVRRRRSVMVGLRTRRVRLHGWRRALVD